MNFQHSFRNLTMVLVALFVTGSRAIACPDCTLISSSGPFEPQTMASKIAFSASTLLFIGIFFTVMGFLIWSMVKACRDLNLERPLSSPNNV